MGVGWGEGELGGGGRHEMGGAESRQSGTRRLKPVGGTSGDDVQF